MKNNKYIFFFLIFISSIIFLEFKLYYLFLFCFTFQIFLIFKFKDNFLIIIFTLTLFFQLNDLISLFNFDSNKENFSGKIIKVYNNSIIVKINNIKVYLFLEEHDLFINQKINFNASLNKIDNLKDNSFKLFLKSNNVSYFSYENEILKIENKFSLRNILYKNLFNSNSSYSEYALCFLFNEFKNYEIKEIIKTSGLSYLFVISGFHINILFIWSNKIFKNEKLNFFLIGFLIYLLFFPLPATRAYLTYYFIRFKKINNFNSLSLTGSIIMINNPFIIFSYSFILSFISTSSIYLINKNINNKFLISEIIFVATFPIIINWNNYFNLLSPFISLILTPIISIIYIVIIISYPFIFIWNFLDYIFIFINFILLFLLNIKIIIEIDVLNIFLIVLLIFYNYFILILSFNLRNKKIISLIFLPYIFLILLSS